MGDMLTRMNQQMVTYRIWKIYDKSDTDCLKFNAANRGEQIAIN